MRGGDRRSYASPRACTALTPIENRRSRAVALHCLPRLALSPLAAMCAWSCLRAQPHPRLHASLSGNCRVRQRWRGVRAACNDIQIAAQPCPVTQRRRAPPVASRPARRRSGTPACVRFNSMLRAAWHVRFCTLHLACRVSCYISASSSPNACAALLRMRQPSPSQGRPSCADPSMRRTLATTRAECRMHRVSLSGSFGHGTPGTSLHP